MINITDILTILHDDNSVFADYTRDAADYARDAFALTLTSAEDYIYVGFNKPINALYAELSVVASDGTITGEYWNGTEWTSLSNLHDDTRGFSRSGFVQWDRNQTGQVVSTVNSSSKYWYRFIQASDASVTFKGINIVFNDINDLKNEFNEIDDSEFLPSSGTHILQFVNARNNIVQKLRNVGYSKVSEVDGTGTSLSPWDMLEIDEVKQAAVYFCLHKILFNFSDAPEDIWAEKSLYYQAQYQKSIDLAKISIDSNNNGLKDASESQRESKTLKFSR